MSKGKKKPVTTPSSSSPSVPPSVAPSVSSQSPSPSLTSIADDTKIKQYMQSVLDSMLSQPGSQVNLGTNPFISAPVEVPDIPSRESTGGRGAESLLRGQLWRLRLFLSSFCFSSPFCSFALCSPSLFFLFRSFLSYSIRPVAPVYSSAPSFPPAPPLLFLRLFRLLLSFPFL